MRDCEAIERGASFLDARAEAIMGGRTSVDGLAMGTYQPAPESQPAGDSLPPAWPDIEPLPDDTIDVQPFAEHMLPDTLRPWVMDIADRLQCPPDFVAVPAVVALGAVLGRKVVIRPQSRTPWAVVPNVWGCIVGRPGAMKSPAVSEALHPLRRLQADAIKAFESEHEVWTDEVEVAKINQEVAKSKAKKNAGKGLSISAADLRLVLPDEPTMRRYCVSDSSLEALGELLRQNPNGLMIERDEIASLLTMLGAEENAGARGFYLTGADGRESYTFDRIGRGLHMHIPAVTLSMLGTTQPGRLASFMRDSLQGGAADDGLMQRFGMLAWPDQTGEWRNIDRWPDTDARRQAFGIFERCDRMTADDVSAEEDNGERFLRFTPEALEAFVEWRTELEELLRSDLLPALESHFAKYRKTIPALALIFHLAEGGTGPVSEAATLRALSWFDYLASHARRCYGASRASETSVARKILERIRRGDLVDGFKARELKRNQWSGLNDGTLIDQALATLCDCGYLVEQKIDHGSGRGRNTAIYRVNPKGVEHGLP